jgi:hypothetical protein
VAPKATWSENFAFIAIAEPELACLNDGARPAGGSQRQARCVVAFVVTIFVAL